MPAVAAGASASGAESARVQGALARFRQLEADCAAARGEFDAWAAKQLTEVEGDKKAHVRRVHDANGAFGAAGGRGGLCFATTTKGAHLRPLHHPRLYGANHGPAPYEGGGHIITGRRGARRGGGGSRGCACVRAPPPTFS